MNSTAPSLLAPFIDQCVRKPSLTLLTSVLDTPTNWLLARFLVAALRRTNSENTNGVAQTVGASAEPEKLVLVSIWRSLELWVEAARKNVGQNQSSQAVSYLSSQGIKLTGCHRTRQNLLY